MKLITAFLRLVRLPNLVMIAVTQLLFYFSLVQPFFLNSEVEIFTYFGNNHLLMLMISIFSLYLFN